MINLDLQAAKAIEENSTRIIGLISSLEKAIVETMGVEVLEWCALSTNKEGCGQYNFKDVIQKIKQYAAETHRAIKINSDPKLKRNNSSLRIVSLDNS